MARRTRLDGVALKAAASQLHEASELVEKKVRPVLDHSPIKDFAYSIKSRTKSTARILRKVEENRKGCTQDDENWGYGPKNVTDGCGVRVVTLFQHDVLAVVKILLEMIKRDSSLALFPFKEDGLHEIKIFTNRPEGDPYAIPNQVRKLVETFGFADRIRPPESKESGYSSVHLIVDVEIELERAYGPSRSTAVPMEIQVRDIFEEGWGEIDHALRYKPDGQRLSDEHQEIKRWLSNLNALKTHCDGCSQQAWIIKERGIPGPDMASLVETTRSTETTQEAIAWLLDVLPSKFHDLVRRIYELRARAQRIMDRYIARDMFDQTLRLLDQLAEEAANHLDVLTIIERPVRYQIEMERAFCFLVGSKEDLQEAVKIYDNMHEQYPQDVVPYYRHGMTMRKLKDIDASIKLFKKGLELLDKDRTIGEDHWVKAALPRNFGFSYWKLAKKLSDDPRQSRQRFAHLRKAHHYTEIAYKAKTTDDLERLQTVNNLIYFTWKYLSLRPQGYKTINKTRLEALLAELEPMANIETSEDFESLETLCVAHKLLGNKDKAIAAANRVMIVLHSFALRRSGMSRLEPTEVAPYLYEEELPAFHSALNEILRNQGILGVEDQRATLDRRS